MTLLELCETNNTYKINTLEEWMRKIYNNEGIINTPHIHTDKFYVHSYTRI